MRSLRLVKNDQQKLEVAVGRATLCDRQLLGEKTLWLGSLGSDFFAPLTEVNLRGFEDCSPEQRKSAMLYMEQLSKQDFFNIQRIEYDESIGSFLFHGQKRCLVSNDFHGLINNASLKDEGFVTTFGDHGMAVGLIDVGEKGPSLAVSISASQEDCSVQIFYDFILSEAALDKLPQRDDIMFNFFNMLRKLLKPLDISFVGYS